MNNQSDKLVKTLVSNHERRGSMTNEEENNLYVNSRIHEDDILSHAPQSNTSMLLIL